MKKSTLQFLFLVSSSFVGLSSYSQDILWEKSYGGKHAEYLMDAIPTADYGFILAGSSLSRKSGNKTDDNNGDLDYWIWKMDEKGDLDWQKSFGGSGSDFLQSIALTNDGGFILGGVSNSVKGLDKTDDNIGQNDFWIIKLNAKGNLEWQKTIGGTSQEKLHSIKHTKDGGFILGGTSSSEATGNKTENSFGSEDCWIVKLDSKGSVVWQKTIGGIYYDELRSIEQTIDGGYVLGAYSNSPASGNKTNDNKGIGDYWIIKLDTKGEIEWQKTIGGDKDDQLCVVHQTFDKGYIVGGNSNSPNSNEKNLNNISGTDLWVLKLNEQAEIVWQETFNFGKVDVLTSIVENEDHSFLLGAYLQSESSLSKGGLGKRKKANENADDYIALKIKENGEELWSRVVGSDGIDVLKKVIETRDGGYLMAGTSNPNASDLSENQADGMSKLNNYTEENKGLQNAKSEVATAINDTQNQINDGVNTKVDKYTQKAKDALGLKKDSPIKLSANDVGGLSLPSLGGSNNATTNGLPEKKLPASRDKKNNLGATDFWVIKLKDESKKKKDKEPIEAFPNPTVGFTNVIINEPYEKGTASLYDLSGRELQSFEITETTIPIDLSGIPAGIYIVEIKTNKVKGSVKIIKGISKN